VSAPSGLLATKLHVPRVQPGFVDRARLTGLLDEGLAEPGRLVLVRAPAGFGKTSLLAAWASAQHRPLAWLSLDEGDNDPARFWRYAAAALDRVRPGISGRITPLLPPAAAASPDGVVTALVNELAEDQALLVLDDFHLIEPGPVHDGVAFLIEHLPPGLRLVIATRADPPLRLGRLRVRRGLTEIQATDLRFTPQEAAALLRGAVLPSGTALSTDAISKLTARTEGWAAGLQLAGLSVRGQPDADAFVAVFSGSHRYVLDYLAEEVLERLAPDVRDFLLETSVLDRLCGELCDAVTGRPGGQAMLERIERAGLFVIPLDEERGWYRYHHLFAELLEKKLSAERSGLTPAALHHAAAAWHAARGVPGEAVRHALAAGEPEWAGILIEQYFDAVYFTGEKATLARWLAALPADLVHRRTRLGLVRAFMALTSGDLPGATDALATVKPDTDEIPDTFRPSVGTEASLLGNIGAATAIAHAWLAYLRGDAAAMSEFAAQARGFLRDHDRLTGSIYQLNLALADWLSGRLDDAERCFETAIDWWRAAGQQALATQGCNYLGQIRRSRGDLDGALAAYRELLGLARFPSGSVSPVAGAGHVGIAELLYQRGEFDAARRELATGLPLCRQLSDTQALGVGLATLGWIRQAAGDPAGARDAMAEAERVGPNSAVADLLNPVPAQRARLLLAQGDVAAAARWTSGRGLSPGDEPGYPRERDYLVLARVLLANGRPAAADGLLGRLLTVATSQGRAGSVIEIRALRALALAAGGDEPAAAAELSVALTLASPEGYIRVFADEGAPMASLLRAVLAGHRDGAEPARRVPLGYLAAVLRACEPAAQPDSRGAGAGLPGLVEPLTRRELEVLELLAAGSPNQRIADDLVVTLDTVKKHVTHVLGKLGAANRTEAVARARDLGLLDREAQRGSREDSTRGYTIG
jgi:LuxR family maltose regulon positive regulatory protein